MKYTIYRIHPTLFVCALYAPHIKSSMGKMAQGRSFLNNNNNTNTNILIIIIIIIIIKNMVESTP